MSVRPSFRPSVRNLQVRWVSIIGLSSYYTGCFMGWFCMSGWKKNSIPPLAPPWAPFFTILGVFWPILRVSLKEWFWLCMFWFMCFWEVLGIVQGVFSHFFKIFNFGPWGGVLKIGGLKPLNMHFFNRGMLYRHVIYRKTGLLSPTTLLWPKVGKWIFKR